jgi:hypothetical protein
MPKKTHWTKTKAGKEKLVLLAKERQAKKEIKKHIDQVNAVAPAPWATAQPAVDPQYEQQRFQRKPRELVMDINSLHLRFYFD